MSKKKTHFKSVMLVDDDEDALDIYSRLLADRCKARIEAVKFPSAALKQATKHFFDLILIDVTMHYRGTPFGGLELYKSLAGRYGDSSMILYSQYITDELVKQHDGHFNFLEKGSNLNAFIDKVLDMMETLRKRQSCFVAMPFHAEYDAVFRCIEGCILRAGYRCVRVDQEAFTKSIVEKIFGEIEAAKFLVFLATDQNPNAFYECGYAVALNKEVITLTDVFKNLPFDIRDRNALAYGDDLKLLDAGLSKKLETFTIVN